MFSVADGTAGMAEADVEPVFKTRRQRLFCHVLLVLGFGLAIWSFFLREPPGSTEAGSWFRGVSWDPSPSSSAQAIYTDGRSGLRCRWSPTQD
jgi:hypothetical protein